MDAEKILEILLKVDRLLAFAQKGAKFLDDHKALMQKHYPDTIPPDAPESFEEMLRDTEGVKAELEAAKDKE